MVGPGPSILGPLVLPECRRALSRGWLIVVRTLAALAVLIATMSVVWYCETARDYTPTFQPTDALRIGLTVAEFMILTTAVMMAPAVMAGSLAGEKERGSLGLLLTTRVNSFEIVAGRAAGKLSQIGMMVLAMLPGLLLNAYLLRLRPADLLALLLLPSGVALGACGVAAAASAVCRRGRDALLVVYLVFFLFLLVPLAAGSGSPFEPLASLSPYRGLADLTLGRDTSPALTTALTWIVMGLIGLAVASWRLRASCLRHTASDVRAERGLFGGLVPPVGDRPMLWKELHIERAGTLGKFGRWIGGFIILLLFGLGAALTVFYALGSDLELDTGLSGVYGHLAYYVWYASFPVLFLVQWAVGLRAAVAISSERERGTWDGLLTSPLEGGEIIRGKLWGSLYALRYLLLAAFWLWTAGAVCGVFRWQDVPVLFGHALIVGAFLSAVGVRVSLSSATATRSMAITIGVWLGAYAVAVFAGGLVTLILILLGLVGLLMATLFSLVPQGTGPTFLVPLMQIGFQGTMLIGFLIATSMIVSESALRFDRIAGRLSGGEIGIAVDEFIHGRPLEPVRLDGPNPTAETIGHAGAEEETAAGRA